MSIVIKGIVFIAVILISIGLVYVMRIHALKKGILDVPNVRSSHKKPTPRGGGLGFIIPLLFSLIILRYFKIIPLSFTVALFGGGTLVAILGWMDDNGGLTAGMRVLFHFLAASWAVFWLGGFPGLNLGLFTVHFSWFGSILAVIGTVWMTNLYNFMDGIDGIAGTEAVSVAVVAAIFIYLRGENGLAYFCGFTACSVTGFLVWNWPPAKIFMGDVGSVFLGFIFSVLMLLSEKTGVLPLMLWFVLLGVFIVDATATLLYRIGKGEKWYEAHRCHVYQLAVQAGYSHRQVTLTVLGINMILALVAAFMFIYTQWMLSTVVITLVTLIIIQIILRKKFNEMISAHIATGLKTEALCQPVGGQN